MPNFQQTAYMKKIVLPFLVLSASLSMSKTIYAQMNNPKTKATLNHIAIYVVDLQKSRAFYETVIGLDTIPEPFRDNKHTWFSIGPKSHLHLIQGAAAVTSHEKNNHLCFSVASVEEFVKRLEKYSVSYENWTGEKNTITKRVDGVKQIYCKDPDGYWVEINDAKE